METLSIVQKIYISLNLRCDHLVIGKPFTHNWQDYRTRKARSLKTISDAGHEYPAPSKYTTYVKVIDTFGCDTSITVEIEV